MPIWSVNLNGDAHDILESVPKGKKSKYVRRALEWYSKDPRNLNEKLEEHEELLARYTKKCIQVDKFKKSFIYKIYKLFNK